MVETIGFRDDLWLDNPMTEAARVTERFRRIDLGKLEVEITVDDPKAYTCPGADDLLRLLRLVTPFDGRVRPEQSGECRRRGHNRVVVMAARARALPNVAYALTVTDSNGKKLFAGSASQTR